MRPASRCCGGARGGRASRESIGRKLLDFFAKKHGEKKERKIRKKKTKRVNAGIHSNKLTGVTEMATMTDAQKAAKTARDKARREAQKTQNATTQKKDPTKETKTEDQAAAEPQPTPKIAPTGEENKQEMAEDALHAAALEVARGLARKLVADKMPEAIAELSA